jgi:SAM-dependent methyltransferase
MDIKIEPCLGCDYEQMDSIRPYRTITKYGTEVFGNAWLYSCARCGLVQVFPRPDEKVLGQYYESDYRRGGYHGSDVCNPEEFPKDNLFYFNRGFSIAECVAPYIKKPNPRILDIGAGFGHILYALSQKFPLSTRLAIEFSEICTNHLQSIGTEVYTEPVEEVLPKLEGQFDLIVLSHVFEHLLELRPILRLIRNSLVSGGILYIEVPNIPADSLLQYPDHKWAPRFDEPHITFFSMPILQTILKEAGFEVSFCNTAGPQYEYISRLRFGLPPLMSTVQSLMPSKVFFFLRKLRLTNVVRVQEKEESFYQYGGCRLWIRSVSTKVGE